MWQILGKLNSKEPGSSDPNSKGHRFLWELGITVDKSIRSR